MDPILKRLTPTYIVLFLRNMAWAITLSGPVILLYVRSLGVDIVYQGVLTISVSAGLFIEVVWGMILDRFDRRLFILSALVGTSLLYPLYTIKALLPSQFSSIFGAVNVIIGLTTRVVIDENIPAKSSGFYMSLRFFFSTFGFIVGPILGTFIVTTYGYGYAFYTSSTIVLVATAYYGFYYQHNKEKQIPKRRNEISLLVSVKRLFTIPTLRTTYLITLLSVFETSGISSFLPIYASARAVGVSLCFSTGVLSIATHSSAAPKGLSGIALGLYGTFEDIGLMVGATVFGLTWAIFGPKSIFVISSGTAIVAALLALTIREDKQ